MENTHGLVMKIKINGKHILIKLSQQKMFQLFPEIRKMIILIKDILIKMYKNT